MHAATARRVPAFVSEMVASTVVHQSGATKQHGGRQSEAIFARGFLSYTMNEHPFVKVEERALSSAKTPPNAICSHNVLNERTLVASTGRSV